MQSHHSLTTPAQFREFGTLCSVCHAKYAETRMVLPWVLKHVTGQLRGQSNEPVCFGCIYKLKKYGKRYLEDMRRMKIMRPEDY